MKINCSKTELSEAVSNVSRAVCAKTTIQALEGILLKAQDGKLKLSAYDLEIGISTCINATIEETGDAVISARLLFDMVRRMPAERISIEVNDKNNVNIKGGVTEFNIIGMNPEDYPDLPNINAEETIEVDGAAFKSMINQTIFSVAVNDTRPVQTGTLFESDGENLTMVSVDGFRLALRREAHRGSCEKSFIVPAKTLSEISKLINDEDCTVSLSVSKKHIIIEVNGYTVISRLLEGEFLDYKSAIPQEAKTKITVNVRSLAECVERVSLLITDRLKSPIRCLFENNMIKISCNTTIGKSYDEIACEIEGEGVEMGFNNKFLLDALKACDSDKICLEILGPLSPMKLVPIEGESFLFLVLPVRIK